MKIYYTLFHSSLSAYAKLQKLKRQRRHPSPSICFVIGHPISVIACLCAKRISLYLVSYLFRSHSLQQQISKSTSSSSEGSSAYVYSTLHPRDSLTQSLNNSRTGSSRQILGTEFKCCISSSSLSLTIVENYALDWELSSKMCIHRFVNEPLQ